MEDLIGEEEEEEEEEKAGEGGGGGARTLSALAAAACPAAPLHGPGATTPLESLVLVAAILGVRALMGLGGWGVFYSEKRCVVDACRLASGV